MVKVFHLFLFLLVLNTAFAQAPQGIEAKAYECHIELEWQSVANATAYKIYRADSPGGAFVLAGQTAEPYFLDWVCDEGQQQMRSYQVSSISNTGIESSTSSATTVGTAPMSDSALLDMVQRATFQYFWKFGHPVSGMARERDNGNDDIVTTGGTGFGILSILVACERGWITRTEGLNRLVQIGSFLQFANRFHGVFPHWMDGNNGKVVPFSTYDNGGDLVETSFLMQGLLAARRYFNQNTPLESGLRSIITGLWESVEFDWYRKNNSPVLYWHWSPNYGWQMNFPLRGFYEAQIVYILASASPTHPVPGSLYTSGWTSSNYANYSNYYGYPIYCGPYGGGPMFFAHYSYLGFDPRNIKDSYCNYFARNRNHALIQQKYCSLNPKNYQGYSSSCWGLTSSDDPVQGYMAHDMYPSNDNGTIAPTAALASMPYVPEESMAALRYFYRQLGNRIWGKYGFYDAFNLSKNWVSNSYLAIDQGPIVAMIENARSGLLWNLFMQNPEIQPALDAIGFKPDFVSGTDTPEETAQFEIFPNPSVEGKNFQIMWHAPDANEARIQIFSSSGKMASEFHASATLMQETTLDLDIPKNLSAGVYWVRISSSRGQFIKKWVIQHP